MGVVVKPKVVQLGGLVQLGGGRDSRESTTTEFDLDLEKSQMVALVEGPRGVSKVLAKLLLITGTDLRAKRYKSDGFVYHTRTWCLDHVPNTDDRRVCYGYKILFAVLLLLLRESVEEFLARTDVQDLCLVTRESACGSACLVMDTCLLPERLQEYNEEEYVGRLATIGERGFWGRLSRESQEWVFRSIDHLREKLNYVDTNDLLKFLPKIRR